MTAVMTMEPKDGGTLYTARAIHRTEVERDRHSEMGFADGWGTVTEQLAAMVEK